MHTHDNLRVNNNIIMQGEVIIWSINKTRVPFRQLHTTPESLNDETSTPHVNEPKLREFRWRYLADSYPAESTKDSPLWVIRLYLRWMASFLLDRTQRVKIENNYSYTGHPNGGVPQGTICGPKCFMIYINDLSTPVPLYKYVDDSTLFELCEMNSISLMQESVNIAAEWTNNNDMKINSEKSKEMIISFSHGAEYINRW